MKRIGDFVRIFWDAPDELLVADLWRGAVIFATGAALLALVFLYQRRRVTGWPGAGLVLALALLALSIVARPASPEAAAMAACAFAIAAAVLVAAGSKRRRPLLLLTGGVICVAVASTGFHASWFALATERAEALEEMRRRPGDPWPRGTGHVMLSPFAAPVEQRGWLEAGGSFSPALRSFGISIWVVDSEGGRLATSDDIPLADTRHAFRRTPGGQPAIEVTTPYYTALWSVLGSGRYGLVLRDLTDAGGLELAVRSVGPAGGPLLHIAAGPRQLALDGGWLITLPDDAVISCVGDERLTSLDDPCTAREATSPAGWAFAKLSFGKADTHLGIATAAPAADALPAYPAPEGMVLTGFPADFTDRLTAQSQTLLTGIVGNETRPGDPVNYPLSWQRDGAYMLVALARAGYAAQARKLAGKFATDDFFGGFGSEADAPGLSLWALSEVATALADPEFDASIWEHIVRKVALIDAMLTTEEELRAPYTGPIVPRAVGRSDLDLVAGPAESGLIRGRMDWHWPLFYVNAVSYLGLVEAAALATRSGHHELAAEWSAMAASIRSAYRNRMSTGEHDDPETGNPRTAISGLWPADIAEAKPFRVLLEGRWSAEQDADGAYRKRPLWTYFSFAQAHQWLRLGDPERVLRTLDWFTAHDAVPGLQVFWEGDGEENSFGGWREVRGHLQPEGVTPHYWSSAEALLLSLEMLAFVDGNGRRLTIGGGVPRAWFGQPLRARSVGTSRGPVSWRWDGAGCIEVDAPPELSIALGAGFPRDTIVIRAPAEACRN